MEQYFYFALFFLAGFVFGNILIMKAFLKIKKQNNSLKNIVMILKKPKISSKKGRIIVQGEVKK